MRRTLLDRIFRGRGGDSLALVEILREEIFHRIELRRMGPAGLGDGSVVIVARGLGTERRVASGPPAERRSAVRHVNGEARPVLEHILEIG